MWIEVKTSSFTIRSEIRIEVLIIVAVPRHERDEHVPAERELAELGRRPVGDDLAGLDRVTDLHQRALVDAGVLVRALELHQRVDVDARFTRLEVAGDANDDAGGVDLVDDARTAGGDGGAGIARHRLFHAGADQRRLGLEQRHRLALHVRTHQRAVGVVVLEERNERGGNRHQLLGADVHQGDLLARSDQEVAVAAGRDDLLGEGAGLGQLGVGLGDRVLRLFHRRQVDDLVGHLAVDDLAVRRLDEAVLVDPAEAGEPVDQADVRAFRSLDRADPAIMGRVDVADFEARALTGQAAGPERRHAALVGDFRQRVGLVHELRQLRRAEEFAHRGDRRLGVDQVVGHDRRHVDAAHALLDRALHAQQADAILVLEQLADRADAAVGEVVDIVDLALAVLEVHQLLDDREDVFLAQRRDGVLGVEAKAHVELDAADRGQVIALGVEEQAVEQGVGGLARRRLAGAHDAVDVGQRAVAVFALVGLQRVADPRTGVDVVDVEQLELLDARLVELGEVLRR